MKIAAIITVIIGVVIGIFLQFDKKVIGNDFIGPMQPETNADVTGK